MCKSGALAPSLRCALQICLRANGTLKRRRAALQRENAAPFSEPTPSKVEKRKRQRDEAVVIDLTHLPVRAARKRLVGTFVRRRLTEYSLLTRPRRFPSG